MTNLEKLIDDLIHDFRNKRQALAYLLERLEAMEVILQEIRSLAIAKGKAE